MNTKMWVCCIALVAFCSAFAGAIIWATVSFIGLSVMLAALTVIILTAPRLSEEVQKCEVCSKSDICPDESKKFMKKKRRQAFYKKERDRVRYSLFIISIAVLVWVLLLGAWANKVTRTDPTSDTALALLCAAISVAYIILLMHYSDSETLKQLKKDREFDKKLKKDDEEEDDWYQNQKKGEER